MLEEFLSADSESSHVAFLNVPRTPAGPIRLACALHAVSTSLAEFRDLLEWFGVSRTRQAVHYWFHAYAETCEQEFIAEPDRVAVDEKQIQLAEEGKSVALRRHRRRFESRASRTTFSKSWHGPGNDVSSRTERGTQRLRHGVPRRRHGLPDGAGQARTHGTPRLHRPQHRRKAVSDVYDTHRPLPRNVERRSAQRGALS